MRDHFTEAEHLLAEADQSGPQTARDLTARAHVHALLAVAESQAAQVQHIRKAVH